MISDIRPILKQLELKDTGKYDDQFYIITLANSDEYAAYYSKLDKLAVNTESPSIGTNTNKSTVKITNYFETEIDNITYDLFLIADFDADKYYLKIKER